MLEEIGLQDIEDLYRDIPKQVRLKDGLRIPRARTELDVRRHVEKLLSKNMSGKDMPTFLGGGCWPHYVPAAVDDLLSRGEFLTSYTPYQPEMA